MNLNTAKSLQSLIHRLVSNLEAASAYGDNPPPVYQKEAEKALKLIYLNLDDLNPTPKKERRKNPAVTAWRREYAKQLGKLKGLSGSEKDAAVTAFNIWKQNNPSPGKKLSIPQPTTPIQQVEASKPAVKTKRTAKPKRSLVSG